MAERRLFFALWPDEAVRLQLAGHRPRHGRRVHPEDLHITLVFLGNLNEARQTELEAAADRIDGEGFELVLDRYGGFRRSRIAWLGASLLPAPLAKLQAALAAAAETSGVAREARDYVPHVTLARDARTGPTAPIVPIRWPVDSFCLVESAGGREGPRYRVLRRWPLSGSTDS